MGHSVMCAYDALFEALEIRKEKREKEMEAKKEALLKDIENSTLLCRAQQTHLTELINLDQGVSVEKLEEVLNGNNQIRIRSKFTGDLFVDAVASDLDRLKEEGLSVWPSRERKAYDLTGINREWVAESLEKVAAALDGKTRSEICDEFNRLQSLVSDCENASQYSKTVRIAEMKSVVSSGCGIESQHWKMQVLKTDQFLGRSHAEWVYNEEQPCTGLQLFAKDIEYLEMLGFKFREIGHEVDEDWVTMRRVIDAKSFGVLKAWTQNVPYGRLNLDAKLNFVPGQPVLYAGKTGNRKAIVAKKRCVTCDCVSVFRDDKPHLVEGCMNGCSITNNRQQA